MARLVTDIGGMRGRVQETKRYPLNGLVKVGTTSVNTTGVLEEHTSIRTDARSTLFFPVDKVIPLSEWSCK